MITYRPDEDIFATEAEAIVNTVNCVGIMGKGLALKFKHLYPDNFERYKKACDSLTVTPGVPYVVKNNLCVGPTWIINFPTKDDWRDPSQMEWIVDGLMGVKSFLVQKNVKSIAIPMVGCGNGGLLWEEVNQHIEDILGEFDGIDIFVYGPKQ